MSCIVQLPIAIHDARVVIHEAAMFDLFLVGFGAVTAGVLAAFLVRYVVVTYVFDPSGDAQANPPDHRPHPSRQARRAVRRKAKALESRALFVVFPLVVAGAWLLLWLITTAMG